MGVGKSLAEKKQERIRKIVVKMLHNDGIWRKHQGKIGTDGSLQVGDKVWADAAEFIKLEPTIGRQLGFTRGVRSVVHVNEWSAVPVDVSRNGNWHMPIPVDELRTLETPYDLSKFKKDTTLEQIRRVGETPNLHETIKMLMYGALAGIGILILMFLYLLNNLGILHILGSFGKGGH